MVVRDGCRQPGDHAGAQEYQRHPVARGGVVLVPRDRQQRALRLESGRVEDRGHLLRQPRIACPDRAVVHVVAHVGSDERVIRRGRRGLQVGGHLRERHHVRLAPRGVGADVVEVDERVVLLRVWIAVPDEAGGRHRLLVSLPAAAPVLQGIREVGGRHPARCAVRRDAVRAASGEREVVGQARVRDAEVAGGQRARRQEAVDVGRGGAADDLAVRVVLHHDHEHVVVGRHGRGGLRRLQLMGRSEGDSEGYDARKPDGCQPSEGQTARIVHTLLLRSGSN